MLTAKERRRRAHLAPAAGLFGASILYFFPPDRYGFYPQCPFHAVTGLLCPGCGATRALAALVHGNLGEAMRRNALAVVMLALAAAYGLMVYRRVFAGEERVWPAIPQAGVYAGLGVALVFGVARNLL